MFPIRDHNPSGRVPFVVYGLMAINIVVFLMQLPVQNDPQAIHALYSQYAFVPARIANGVGYETLVTSQFMHAGLMHIAGNMLFLWIFGDNLEHRMGHIPFLLFYLISGVGAAVIQVAADPGSPVPMVGASGAIAGVMGGYLLLFPKARVDILLFLIIIIRIFPIPSWVMLMLWFGMQIVGGIGSDPTGGGVAYWAHAGGFVVGLILCLPLWMRLGATAFWDKTLSTPPHPEAEYAFSQSRIPRVSRGTRSGRRGPWG